MKITHKNEQLKIRFYEYLKSVKQFSNTTIHRYENAIWLWEDFTENDFSSFNETMAIEFTEWIKNKKKANSQENVSLSYCYHILRFIKLFFEWLCKQKGYKRMDSNTVDYLQLTKKEVREAIQPKNVECPEVEEVRKAVEHIKGATEIEMRDKALLSLAILTGARIEAMMTLPMKSFDKKELILHQDPQLGVRTKNSTPITSVLIPFFYKETLNYFLQWYDYLEVKGFKPEDPIFPMTKIENGKDNINYYNTGKVEPIFLKSQTALRKIFEKRFTNAGVKYYHPHTFRHLLVKQISKLPLTEEQKKAFSQNFGHANMGTTFRSYGGIGTERQIEVIRNVDFDGQKKEVKQYISIDEARQLLKEQESNGNKSS